jgi:hypothetical protein
MVAQGTFLLALVLADQVQYFEVTKLHNGTTSSGGLGLDGDMTGAGTHGTYGTHSEYVCCDFTVDLSVDVGAAGAGGPGEAVVCRFRPMSGTRHIEAFHSALEHQQHQNPQQHHQYQHQHQHQHSRQPVTSVPASASVSASVSASASVSFGTVDGVTAAYEATIDGAEADSQSPRPILTCPQPMDLPVSPGQGAQGAQGARQSPPSVQSQTQTQSQSQSPQPYAYTQSVQPLPLSLRSSQALPPSLRSSVSSVDRAAISTQSAPGSFSNMIQQARVGGGASCRNSVSSTSGVGGGCGKDPSDPIGVAYPADIILAQQRQLSSLRTQVEELRIYRI